MTMLAETPATAAPDRKRHRISKLCREFRIEIIDNRRNKSRAARQTCAVRTLERLVQTRGYAHMRLVLMSIVETKNNKRMLVAPVILAVSDVLRAHGNWFGDQWLKAMDAIELEELYALAKHSRRAVRPRWAIATMLIERIRPHFTEQPKQRLI